MQVIIYKLNSEILRQFYLDITGKTFLSLASVSFRRYDSRVKLRIRNAKRLRC